MSFRHFFFKPSSEGGNEGLVGKEQGTGQNTSAPANSPSISVNATESEKYVALFREAITKQGGIGIKFIKLLYEIAKEPTAQDSEKDSQKDSEKDSEKDLTAEDYKKAFSFLQIMDSTLSTQSILSSLTECEGMISSETDNYLKQGNAKKEELETTRKNERSQLEGKIQEINTSISQLQKELNEKNAELTKNKTELEKLDGKFAPKLNETIQTINAVSSASKLVLESLSQIKEGINNNLK